MSFLSFKRLVDEASGTYDEELVFFGASLVETDTEMRQWIMRTMPLGACQISIETMYVTDGTQHRITVSYTCRQKTEDRVEPKGIFG